MSRLRERLIEQYARQYKRVNFYDTDPSSISSRTLEYMDLMFRDLVAPLPNGSRVLDLGCGTGLLLAWLARQPGLIPVGVDSSESQIEIARKSLPGIEVTLADGLEYLAQNPNTFAGILCNDVLEHIPGEDQCLAWVEAARNALIDGGFFCCRVPNASNLTGSHARYIDLTHERAFTDTSLFQLLEAAGLQDCRIVPVRAKRPIARLRLFLERILHTIVYLICGQGGRRVYTNNISACGYKKTVDSR